MAKAVIQDLTSGSMEGTFEEALISVQNYGFSQSVFEVERMADPKSGAAGKGEAGEVAVLRPSATPLQYLLMKPGDQVRCLGLRKTASGGPGLYRIRRMAEGLGRKTMTERT